MITVDVVTPSRKVVSGVKASHVTLPAHLGEMDVLPGHTEVLTLLRTGILAFDQEGKERIFAVSYGFAEVAHDRVMVLAETCEESKEIDIERARASQAKAEQLLSGNVEPEAFEKYHAKLERALIRQHVGGHG
jgi:F-type H+-transporting ATPase subunit epsilon